MERFGPRFGGVVGELGVNDVPDRVGPGDDRRDIASDDDGGDARVGDARARERERLPRVVDDDAALIAAEYGESCGYDLRGP